jgi:hypothetical protein
MFERFINYLLIKKRYRINKFKKNCLKAHVDLNESQSEKRF